MSEDDLYGKMLDGLKRLEWSAAQQAPGHPDVNVSGCPACSGLNPAVKHAIGASIRAAFPERAWGHVGECWLPALIAEAEAVKDEV